MAVRFAPAAAGPAGAGVRPRPRVADQVSRQSGVMVPRAEDVASARSIAHWVFGALYGVDPASLLQAEEAEQSAVTRTVGMGRCYS